MKSLGSIGQQLGNVQAQDGVQGNTDKKAIAKQVETVFLNEFLKIMLEQTSFGKDRTVSTYLPVFTSEIAKSLSERGIGIGDFLIRGRNDPGAKGNESAHPQSPGKGGDSSPHFSPPVEGRVSSGYGMRSDPIDGKPRHHNGLDIAVPEGTPIRPAAPGKVISSGKSESFGNYVVLQHEDGMTTLYAHNSVNYVRAGEVVDKEKIIALSGSTGRTTGPHLHFEVRKGEIPRDPEGMLS